MFDLGWSELLLIGVVALIVVGPRDFPKMFRTVGRYVGHLKVMAREFQRTMDKAADDAGVGEVSKGLKAATNPKQFGMDKFEEIAKDMKKDFMMPKPVGNSILSSDRNSENQTFEPNKENAALSSSTKEMNHSTIVEQETRTELSDVKSPKSKKSISKP